MHIVTMHDAFKTLDGLLFLFSFWIHLMLRHSGTLKGTIPQLHYPSTFARADTNVIP